MDYWSAIVEAFKIGVQAKNARDQRKSAEALQAAQRDAEASAARSTDQLAKQAFTAQANAARMAYGSLTSPGTLQASGPSVTGLDAYLPMIVVGVVALAVISFLFKK
jgi:hypothetical protein